MEYLAEYKLARYILIKQVIKYKALLLVNDKLSF